MLKDKIKGIFNKTQDGDNKKKIENLVVFIIILIVTLIVINVIWKEEENDKKDTSNDPNKKLASTIDTNTITNTNSSTQDSLSLQLEEILGKIDGVGSVKVLITYSQTNETIPMYNEDTSQKDTEEKDTSRWNKKSSWNRCKKRNNIWRK